MLNVVLTAVSGSFLFLLGRRWWGLLAGISAYLLWIACPSQTIYNSLVLSEPLYTTLMLGALVLLTAGEGRRPILRGVAAGLVLRWFNGVRPIAAVVIIALLSWRLVLKPEEWLLEESRRYWLGLTCAQMLVEVAGRYHYSLIPVLLLLGQAALFPPAPAETKIFQKNRESS